MKKIFYLITIIFPLTLLAAEKNKEERIARYIMENIQKDYVNCYSFYKVAAESFKKAGKEKQIINNLEKSADVTLKYNYELGEIMGLNPEVMAQMTEDTVKDFIKLVWIINMKL